MKKPKILLADDHPDMLETVAQILEPTFEIVGRLGDGQALLEAVRKQKPDVIVVDISLPVLNGLEAANKLKLSGSTARIVFLTAHDDQDFVNACLASGALGYVYKAQMAVDLIAAINEALEGRTFVSDFSKSATARHFGARDF